MKTLIKEKTVNTDIKTESHFGRGRRRNFGCLPIITFFLLLTSCVFAFGQEDPFADIVNNIGKQQVKTINGEVKDAILFLQEIPESERIYIRFFTVAFLPTEELKQDAWLQLSFVCHSLMGVPDSELLLSGSYKPIAIRNNIGTKEAPEYEFIVNNRVSDTLCWIDIRDFGWTPESMELVSLEDGYFVEPVVDNDVNGLLRLLSGNAVFRADWFINHGTNVLAQVDNGKKTLIYRELLYSGNKTKPKTVQEFRTIWGVPDLEKAQSRGNSFLTLTVNESKLVARHNRILLGLNSDLGYIFQSYDVNSETGKRDYVSNFLELKGKPPEIFDAGEIFASNNVGMQVYDLLDSKGNLINDANAGVARHLSDVIGDARVRISSSCIDCHAEGPIPSENTIKEFLNSKVGSLKGGISTYDYADKLRIERNYLSDKFEDLVKDSQVKFARSLKKINGLEPAENVKSYLNVISWYNQPLDLKQIVLETGYSEKEILEKCGGLDLVMHTRRRVHPRVSLLLVNKIGIPRENWEGVGRDGQPGSFQDLMLTLKGVTKITETKSVITEKVIDIVKPAENSTVYKLVVEKPNSINLDGKWITLPIGTELEFLGEQPNNVGTIWYKVNINGKVGFILPEVVEQVKK